MAMPPSTTWSAICASRCSGASRPSRRSSSSATSPSAPWACRSPIKPPHPAVYLFLITPFGVVGGYVSVALGYVLAQGGFDAQGVAALVAVYFLPQTWKFLWAPVADLTLTRRRWHVIAALLCALSLLSLGITPIQAE